MNDRVEKIENEMKQSYKTTVKSCFDRKLE